MPIDFAKGIATQALNNGLRKVAGNVPGLLGKIRGKDGVRDSSDLKDLNNTKTSGVSPKLLQFPLDIDSDPGVGNHGHYIIFYINEFEKTKLKFGDFAPEGQGAINLQIEEAQRKLQSKIKQVIQNGGFPESITEEELKKQGGSFQYDSKNFIKGLGRFPLELIYDHYLQLITVSIAGATLLSVYLYISSFYRSEGGKEKILYSFFEIHPGHQHIIYYRPQNPKRSPCIDVNRSHRHHRPQVSN